MVTIKDIAQLTNFSVTTVSRALNDHYDVSLETKQKIKKAAKALNYFPNANAQRLVTKKSNKIGFIIFGFGKASGEDNFVYEILTGLQKECIELGYELVFLLGSLFLDKKKSGLEDLYKKYDLAGLIVMGISRNEKFYQELETFNYPLICIDGDIIGEKTSNVQIDNYAAETEATKYLVEQKNRRNIIFVSGSEGSVACLLRAQGYSDVMKKNHLRSEIVHGNYSYDEAYLLINQELSKDRTIDGILAANDMMAIGAIKAIEEHGLIVSKDIDVIGFDDIVVGSLIKTKLTTIRQDREKIARTAVNVVDKIIKEEAFEQENLIPYELIIRETA